VVDIKVAPAALEVFDDQAAVTLLRLILAAQEAAAGQEGRFDFFLDAAFLHQAEEIALIIFPPAFVLFVGIEQVLRGGQERGLDVIHVQDFLQEILEVVAFAEAGELGDLVEADVHYAFDAGSAEFLEKLSGSLLGEADGENGNGVGGHTA
jgi:hypothetical protein